MRCRILVFFVGLGCLAIGAILTIAGVILYGQFDSLFGEAVRKQMYIDDQVLWWYKVWLNPPLRETLTVHLFEVENSHEIVVDSRTRAQLREVGPFVFRVERFKEKVNFTGDDRRQIHYEERTAYHFDPLLSYEDLGEKITVVNSELMSLNPFITAMVRRASSVSRLSKSLNASINDILSLYKANLFVDRTIGDIMFGHGKTPTSDSSFETESDMDNSIEMVMSKMHTVLMVNNTELKTSITDQTTIQILSLYAKVKPFISDRLGVDVDPFNLIPVLNVNTNQVDSNDDKSSAAKQSSTKPKIKLINSVSEFFPNNSREKFDVFTGLETNQNAEIIRWNNQNIMKAWFGRSCNMINGTDGRQFTPFVKAETLFQFNPRICRSVPMTLKDEGMTQETEITYQRFVRSDYFFQSPFKNSANGCFCRWSNNTQRCNYDGILDISTCYAGAPVILTNPHFSGRITRSIARQINGLNPDGQFLESYIDVEPVSGIVINKVSKFQFNVHIRQTPIELNSNRTLQEFIFPLFWYEEVSTASADYQNSIKYFFIYPVRYQQLGIFAIIGLGLGAMGVGCLCICCCCSSMTNNDDNNDYSKGSKLKRSSAKVGAAPGTILPVPIEKIDQNGKVGRLENIKQLVLKEAQYDDQENQEYIGVGTGVGANYFDNENYIYEEEEDFGDEMNPEATYNHNDPRQLSRQGMPKPPPLFQQSQQQQLQQQQQQQQMQPQQPLQQQHQQKMQQPPLPPPPQPNYPLNRLKRGVPAMPGKVNGTMMNNGYGRTQQSNNDPYGYYDTNNNSQQINGEYGYNYEEEDEAIYDPEDIMPSTIPERPNPRFNNMMMMNNARMQMQKNPNSRVDGTAQDKTAFRTDNRYDSGNDSLSSSNNRLDDRQSPPDENPFSNRNQYRSGRGYPPTGPPPPPPPPPVDSMRRQSQYPNQYQAPAGAMSPPPITGYGRGNARQNLLNEIRQGTTLRKTQTSPSQSETTQSTAIDLMLNSNKFYPDGVSLQQQFEPKQALINSSNVLNHPNLGLQIMPGSGGGGNWLSQTHGPIATIQSNPNLVINISTNNQQHQQQIQQPLSLFSPTTISNQLLDPYNLYLPQPRLGPYDLWNNVASPLLGTTTTTTTVVHPMPMAPLPVVNSSLGLTNYLLNQHQQRQQQEMIMLQSNQMLQNHQYVGGLNASYQQPMSVPMELNVAMLDNILHSQTQQANKYNNNSNPSLYQLADELSASANHGQTQNDWNNNNNNDNAQVRLINNGSVVNSNSNLSLNSNQPMPAPPAAAASGALNDRILFHSVPQLSNENNNNDNVIDKRQATKFNNLDLSEWDQSETDDNGEEDSEFSVASRKQTPKQHLIHNLQPTFNGYGDDDEVYGRQVYINERSLHQDQQQPKENVNVEKEVKEEYDNRTTTGKLERQPSLTIAQKLANALFQRRNNKTATFSNNSSFDQNYQDNQPELAAKELTQVAKPSAIVDLGTNNTTTTPSGRIRFFGPYRAYNGFIKNKNRASQPIPATTVGPHQQRTDGAQLQATGPTNPKIRLANELNDSGDDYTMWDSSFDDDDDVDLGDAHDGQRQLQPRGDGKYGRYCDDSYSLSSVNSNGSNSALSFSNQPVAITNPTNANQMSMH